eukprot:4294437-Alexandrium_andersonii.AAC.1
MQGSAMHTRTQAPPVVACRWSGAPGERQARTGELLRVTIHTPGAGEVAPVGLELAPAEGAR